MKDIIFVVTTESFTHKSWIAADSLPYRCNLIWLQLRHLPYCLTIRWHCENNLDRRWQIKLYPIFIWPSFKCRSYITTGNLHQTNTSVKQSLQIWSISSQIMYNLLQPPDPLSSINVLLKVESKWHKPQYCIIKIQGHTSPEKMFFILKMACLIQHLYFICSVIFNLVTNFMSV